MGYLRFSLVIAVIYSHLAGSIIAAGLAVHGFFLLSGYLITLVSHEVYNGGWRDKGYFLANRATRIYPTYISCLLISLAAMQAVGFTTASYHPEYTLPTTAQSWLVQFSIIGLSWFDGLRWPERILLPAWSLSTELVYYALIGLVTGKSRALSTIAFVVSLLATLYWHYANYPFAHFYFSIQGAAVIFFSGAMFYHWRHLFAAAYLHQIWLLILIANAALYLPDTMGLPRKNMLVFYGALAYFGYVVMCMHAISQTRKPTRLDQILADMSYPMFLLHWPVAALVCHFWLGHYARTSQVFWLTLPPLLLAAVVLVYTVELPVKKLRRHFRRKARGFS